MASAWFSQMAETAICNVIAIDIIAAELLYEWHKAYILKLWARIWTNLINSRIQYPHTEISDACEV